MKKHFILLLSIIIFYSCNKDDSNDYTVNSKRPISVSYYENNTLISKDWYTYTNGLITQIDYNRGIGSSYEALFRYSFNYSSSGIEVKYFEVEEESLELLKKATYHYEQSFLVRKDFYSMVDFDRVYLSENYNYQNGVLSTYIKTYFYDNESPSGERIEFQYDGEKLIKRNQYTFGEFGEHANDYYVVEYSDNEIIEARFYDSKTIEISRDIHTFQNGYIVHTNFYDRLFTDSLVKKREMSYQYDADGYLLERSYDIHRGNMEIMIQYESKPSNLNLFRDPQVEFKYRKIPLLPFDFFGVIWGSNRK